MAGAPTAQSHKSVSTGSFYKKEPRKSDSYRSIYDSTTGPSHWRTTYTGTSRHRLVSFLAKFWPFSVVHFCPEFTYIIQNIGLLGSVTSSTSRSCWYVRKYWRIVYCLRVKICSRVCLAHSFVRVSTLLTLFSFDLIAVCLWLLFLSMVCLIALLFCVLFLSLLLLSSAS